MRLCTGSSNRDSFVYVAFCRVLLLPSVFSWFLQLLDTQNCWKHSFTLLVFLSCICFTENVVAKQTLKNSTLDELCRYAWAAHGECPASRNHWQFWRMLTLRMSPNELCFFEGSLWLLLPFLYNCQNEMNLYFFEIHLPLLHLLILEENLILYFSSYFLVRGQYVEMKLQLQWIALYVLRWSSDPVTSGQTRTTDCLGDILVHIHIIYLKCSPIRHYHPGDWDLRVGFLFFFHSFAWHQSASPTHCMSLVGGTVQLILKRKQVLYELASLTFSKASTQVDSYTCILDLYGLQGCEQWVMLGKGKQIAPVRNLKAWSINNTFQFAWIWNQPFEYFWE